MTATAPECHRLGLADGRRLAYDDIGEREGVPIVYVHGTPDCRLCRHPDDTIAARLGVRLVAVDRPGYGDSDYDPAGTFLSFADDVRQLIDQLGFDRYATFGWSGGGPFALACAARDRGRVAAVGVACSLAPIEALGTPDLFDGADEQMQLFADTIGSMSPSDFAAVAAPIFVPDISTVEDARNWISEGANAYGRAELDAVPGALEHLARSALYALHNGRMGIEHDLSLLASPFGFALEDVRTPARLWYGDKDGTATPGMGRYLARNLPDADLTEIQDAAHFLVFPHWPDILRELATLARQQLTKPKP